MIIVLAGISCTIYRQAVPRNTGPTGGGCGWFELFSISARIKVLRTECLGIVSSLDQQLPVAPNEAGLGPYIPYVKSVFERYPSLCAPDTDA